MNRNAIIRGCGVLILSGSSNTCDSILLGNRIDGQGWGLPGGKFDPELDKDLTSAAYRECKEETGLDFTPLRDSLSYMRNVATIVVEYEKYNRDNPMIHESKKALSDIFIQEIPPEMGLSDMARGEPDGEFTELKWFSLPEALFDIKLFPPTRVAINAVYGDVLSILANCLDATANDDERRDTEWLEKTNKILSQKNNLP